MKNEKKYTATHWGNFTLKTDGEDLVVGSSPGDLRSSELGQNLKAVRDMSARVMKPAVRESYLKDGWRSNGAGRGRDAFIEVSWDEAFDLASRAIAHTRAEWGSEAIYGGSYGWASAGRFHHAQSQVHRFLRMGGGYTDSVNTYSGAAAEVIVPHIIGLNAYHACAEAPPIEDIVKHTRLIICFGGAGLKNNEVGVGSIGNHRISSHYKAIREAGVRVVSVACLRDDTAEALTAEWLPCRPNGDVAFMLALAHTLVSLDLHDRVFLERYCHGYSLFEAYLKGATDGIEKDAEWATSLTGIPAERIRALAEDMARTRTLIGLSLSVQRAQYGEQPYWAATALAAMLGQIGLPGGGIAYGFSTINMTGNGRKALPFSVGALSQGENPASTYIPVARIADMLEYPGKQFDYDGKRLTYPDIKLIYWAGGNPFHHHQDLRRLEAAWTRPETIIVNETYWTATARRADIVFPVASILERTDFAGSSSDVWLTPMSQFFPPLGQSKTDYEIFAGLSERLGYGQAFTEGRSADQWVRHLFQMTVENARGVGITVPEYQDFVAGGPLDLSSQLSEREWVLEAFRRDPDANPLPTESGKIQIFSEKIAAFEYPDCIGHPAWYERSEWLGAATAFPLHLVSNQPATKLHSQLDNGPLSQSAKKHGLERLRIHPRDAVARGVSDGDIVRIFNRRGATLACATVTDAVMEKVIQLPTGAWYDPQIVDSKYLEVNSNPNALTLDEGASSLSQGPVAHSCVCEVERYEKTLPERSVNKPPPIINPELSLRERSSRSQR